MVLTSFHISILHLLAYLPHLLCRLHALSLRLDMFVNYKYRYNNNYMNLKETQIAIKYVKDNFQQHLVKKLNLLRVSAPLFLTLIFYNYP